jgi:hypothetical protein
LLSSMGKASLEYFVVQEQIRIGQIFSFTEYYSVLHGRHELMLRNARLAQNAGHNGASQSRGQGRWEQMGWELITCPAI